MALTSPSLPAIATRAEPAALARPIQFAARDPLLKRPFDIALAGVMLALSAPAWAAIALAIKLEDGGPVFYRQERWGRGRIRFQVLKFRSMVPNSDRDFGVRQARVHDRRVTRVGRFLRATGLDELPQVLNIMRGDMSFVGPRALATDEQAGDGQPIRYEETPGFATRLRVRPGLTGLATIYLPKDAPPHLKFRTDLLYVRRVSFWLDIRLVLLSFWISFRGKWETRSRKV
jgi:lipopolysaccharide/colanic/teichoic acid biosynthesis glycosyltransferase